MASHAVRDHVVVFDDQDLGHAPTIVPCTAFFGFPNGDDLVTRFFGRKGAADDGEPEIVAIPLEAEDPTDDAMYDASFDALRTGFTAAVSHELRTPLARILVLLDTTDAAGTRMSTRCSSRPAPRSSTPAR